MMWPNKQKKGKLRRKVNKK